MNRLLAWVRRAPPALLLLGAGVVFGLAGVLLWGHEQRQVGATRAIEHAASAQLPAARHARDTARAALGRDTVRLVQVIDRSQATADSARALVAREARVHDSLATRIGFLAADSARADSALTVTLAQNDTLQGVVTVLVAQRDTVILAARRAVLTATAALRATDSLLAVNEAIRRACEREVAATRRAGLVEKIAFAGVGYLIGRGITR